MESNIYDRIYVGGKWRRPYSLERLEVENPATEEIIGSVMCGDHRDVAAASEAARSALRSWSNTDLSERIDLCECLYQSLTNLQQGFAESISSEVGTPLRTSKAVQVGAPLAVIRTLLDMTRDFEFCEDVGNSTIYQVPIGVIGAIVPWNYPLHQAVAKIAPALIAGCTVVLKPAELAPLTLHLLTQVMDEVGFPPGVFNMVPGLGSVVGEALVTDNSIDLISFTGSVDVGKRVSELAARSVKPVALELGGKSASVLLPDADLDVAVKVSVANAFLNAGQTCASWTRLLAHDDIYQEVVERAAEIAMGFRIGDPLADDTRMGPLISERQRTRVRQYVSSGIDEGATVVCGGVERPKEVKRGYFVQPTVFCDVNPKMKIAEDEIFGPVLSIIRYSAIEEAREIVNDSIYGLSGSVWSKEVESARTFARDMDVGQVDINGGRFNPAAPWGGTKQSGNGRELGLYGLQEFLRTLSIQS